MNKNKIASITMALFSITSTPSYASSQTLDFTGTVSSACAFTSVNNGVLVSPTIQPYLLSSESSAGGTPGSFTINYNSTPTLSISNITGFSSSPSLSGISNPQYTMGIQTTSAGSFTLSNSVYSKTYSSGITDAITINFSAATGNTSMAWPVGNYIASTTVTCQ